jgi:hypothetical protein
MKTDHGFVLVSGSAYINPVAKVAIFSGLFSMETNGTQMFNVYLDPQIDRDRLLSPASEAPLYAKPISNLAGVDPQRPVPFYSSEREKVFEFGFHFGSREDGERHLILQMSDFYLERPEKLRSKFPKVLQDKDVSKWMLEVVMVAFRNYAPTGGLIDGIRRLELWCRQSLLSKLSKDLPHSNPGYASELVRVAERELR